LQQSGAPVTELLGSAIPAAPRPTRSWLAWLGEYGSAQDLADTWAWMQPQGLLDDASAGQAAWALWGRGAYRDACELARSRLASGALLANTRFESSPAESPFDWKLQSAPSVSVERVNGIEVRFAGTENVAYSGPRQFTCVPPGRYRLSAEIEADGLTTDRGPFFHIFDPADQRRVDAATSAVLGTVPRSSIHVDFTVPEGTLALAVQLERRQSELFDNRIAGRLHVYQVSLEALPAVR